MKRRLFNKLALAFPFFTTISFAASKQSNNVESFEKRDIWEYYNLDEYQFSDNSFLHTPEIKEGSIISVFKENMKISLMQHNDIDDIKENMGKFIPKDIGKRCIWVQSKNKHGFFICFNDLKHMDFSAGRKISLSNYDVGYKYKHALQDNLSHPEIYPRG